MSGTPKPYDGHYQSYDELGFSQFQENDGGEISWNGEDDGNPAPQATHSTTVDGLFQPQETEFLSLLSPFSDFQPGLGWIGLGVSSNWREFSTRHLLTHPGSQDLNFWPVEHAAAAHGKSLALLDNVSEYFAAATVLPPVAWEEEEEEEATLLQPPAGLTNAGEQFTAAAVENDEEALLKKLRAAGYGYAAISEKMREQLGIEITANALVKRYQKLPKTCENVSEPPLNPYIRTG